MTHGKSQTAVIPTILFGAFDRHNFGDLLFPHVAAALLESENLVFAGLAQRDLRAVGGHRVRALAQLVAEWGERPVNIFHVGGEILTCDAWQAAVMLLAPEPAHEVIARYEARPQEKGEWAHSQLGIPALAPYSLSRKLFPLAGKVIYNAVGGVDLDECAPALRAEVLANLDAADAVGVRDRQTHASLQAAGITARLLPDPAVMVAQLFGARIRQCAQQGEVAQIAQACPRGYIAVQFSVDFDDDETLAQIAAQLDRAALAHGYGVAFFRAGAAPWHDDLHCYERVAARMRAPGAKIFTSLNLWDICALVAGSRVYLGSSLHGRILAMAFAVPRVNLRHLAQVGRPAKQTAFAATWDEESIPAAVDPQEIAHGIRWALDADPEQLRRKARQLAAHYRQGFQAICAGLT